MSNLLTEKLGVTVDNIRVRIKHGEKEFEVEGPRDAVEAQWTQAKSWIFENETNNTEANNLGLPEGSQKSINSQHFESIFTIDKARRTLKLRILPPRGAHLQRISNASLLLLYGYKEIFVKPELPVTRMAEDLRMSGFAGLKRLSRAFEKLESDGLATRNGSGKGTRYQATIPGLKTAEAISKEILG